MRKLLFVLIFCSGLVPSLSYCQETGAKEFVERGLAIYIKEGPEAAMKTWLKGSGMEGNTQALTQANNFRQLEDYYGKPESYDILKENTISPRSKMIVFAINYAKGVAFVRFQAYRTKSGEWVSTDFKLHSEAAMLLPSKMVYGE